MYDILFEINTLIINSQFKSLSTQPTVSALQHLGTLKSTQTRIVCRVLFFTVTFIFAESTFVGCNLIVLRGH